MAHYPSSTQAKNWVFTKDQIADFRKQLFEETQVRITAAAANVRLTPSLSPPTPATQLAQTLDGIKPFLSPSTLTSPMGKRISDYCFIC